MQKTSGFKIKVGLFVSISAVLLITGIYFIGKRQQLFNTTFRITGIFKDIGGLQVGNNIRYSGINVGIVSNIEQITDSAVRVDMQINQKSRKFIKVNAKAIIGSDGLLGNKLVIIIPGNASNEPIANNDTISTSIPISIDDIMKNVKVTTDNAAVMTADLAVIIGDIRHGKGTIGKLISDSSFANNINQTMVNIKQSAGGLKNNMDAASHSFLLRGFFKKKDKDKNKGDDKNKH